MKRIVVVGGFGFFGSAAARLLRSLGAHPLVGSRRADGDLSVDANDEESIRSVLRPGDVVIDAAGPFQERDTTLIESACEIGFDVVDLSDSLRYARSVLALREKIEQSGVRVLTSSSSVSAVTASLIERSGIGDPEEVTIFLVPASRRSASAGAARSLLGSIGREVERLQKGRLQLTPGWVESRSMVLPLPLGERQGYLFETADVLLLPTIWPSLRDVSSYVDPNVHGLAHLLTLAAHWPPVRQTLERLVSRTQYAVRAFGSSTGGFGVEVSAGSARVQQAFVAAQSAELTAVIPAVLASHAIAESRFESSGLIPPHKHIRPDELLRSLRDLGIRHYRCDDDSEVWVELSERS